MRIYWIDNLQSGKLGMMPRPKGGDWLKDEIVKLKQRNVQTVVSLIEAHEMVELSLLEEAKYCKEQGINFIHYPIVDCSTPSNTDTFLSLSNQLATYLKQNNTIVIHCRMGIGRTSMLTAAVLIALGIPKKGIFTYLSKIRTLEVPDREEQRQWILNPEF